MSKEYQNTMREGFENHIAKQLRLEKVPKAVLAVQVFAMKGQEYADKKLQLKWGEWEAACSQQIEKDAKKCRRVAEYQRNNNYHNLGEFEKSIRNQEKYE